MHYCREKMDDLYFLGDTMTKSGEQLRTRLDKLAFE